MFYRIYSYFQCAVKYLTHVTKLGLFKLKIPQKVNHTIVIAFNAFYKFKCKELQSLSNYDFFQNAY